MKDIYYYIASTLSWALCLSGIFCISSSLFFALDQEGIVTAYFLSLLGFVLTLFSLMSAILSDDIKGR